MFGIEAFPTIADAPNEVDLAVIATPDTTVPQIVRDCAAAGVKARSSFLRFQRDRCARARTGKRDRARTRRDADHRAELRWCDAAAHRIERDLCQAARASRDIGFISQSGGFAPRFLLELSAQLGFSAFISIGSMLDVNWGDLIYQLGDDPHTRSILLYMESIGDARSFLSAAREVALTKPIIVIKVGRTQAAAKAAASHTGALTGSDDVCDAAFRRAGVLRVNTIAELFNIAGCWQTAAPARTAARYRYQWRWSRCARDGYADCQRRRERRALERKHGCARSRPAATLEPRQSDRPHRRRRCRTLCARR